MSRSEVLGLFTWRCGIQTMAVKVEIRTKRFGVVDEGLECVDVKGGAKAGKTVQKQFSRIGPHCSIPVGAHTT